MQYSGKEILGLENTVDEHMLSWMALIRRKYISSDSELRPMDLARKAAFFTMDITTEISFGEPWGCLTKDEDVDKWFESSEQILPNAIMFSTIPWMASLFSIPIIGRLVMPSDRDPIGPGKLLGVIKEIVRKRFEPDDREQKRDMMGSFILHGITKTEAVSEATLQMCLFL